MEIGLSKMVSTSVYACPVGKLRGWCAFYYKYLEPGRAGWAFIPRRSLV